MSEVGSAFVTIVPSAKGFGSAVTKQVGGEVDSAGKSAGKRFGTAFKVGAVAAGIPSGQLFRVDPEEPA